MKNLVPSAPMISKQKGGVSWRGAEDRGKERGDSENIFLEFLPHFFFLSGVVKRMCDLTQYSIRFPKMLLKTTFCRADFLSELKGILEVT